MRLSERRTWIIFYAGTVLFLLALRYLLDMEIAAPIKQYFAVDPLKNLFLTLAVIASVLLGRSILEELIDKLEHAQGERYNLIRITRLLANIVILYFGFSFLFQVPTISTLKNLGLLSLVLGFALQAPITSFIAWLYIVFRRPYQVGDRIQINNHRGDVVEIGYLDTIIEECSGDYLGNDRMSGRMIHFPNSLILTDRVINYSGPQVPFIWNETAVQISYTSDIKFVEECLIQAALSDFNKKYPLRATQNNELWYPAVYFRNNEFAWMEAVVTYPVEPTDTTGRRNRILRAALPLLNAEPGKVQFPEGSKR